MTCCHVHVCKTQTRISISIEGSQRGALYFCMRQENIMIEPMTCCSVAMALTMCCCVRCYCCYVVVAAVVVVVVIVAVVVQIYLNDGPKLGKVNILVLWDLGLEIVKVCTFNWLL